MAHSHLEQLISEYLEWNGFLIKRNTKVGRLSRGGWEMELDIIGYHPAKNILVHYEPSLDAQSWDQREQRYKKKFAAGRKYIKEEIFKWVNEDCVLDQFAIFISHPKNRHELAGGKILSVDELIQQIKNEIVKEGVMSKKAISEIYPLLRTIQMTLNGYYKNLKG